MVSSLPHAIFIGHAITRTIVDSVVVHVFLGVDLCILFICSGRAIEPQCVIVVRTTRFLGSF
jgi:hypothetical protein